jgi:hypothetical protein
VKRLCNRCCGEMVCNSPRGYLERWVCTDCGCVELEDPTPQIGRNDDDDYGDGRE